MLSHARLLQLLKYDPETGLFTRLQNCGPARAGEIAGTVRPDGYIQISVDGVPYLAHRLAWFYTHGVWPSDHTDHADGDRQNNRLANLREATAAQNTMNTGPQVNNTSGAKGVYWSSIRRKWIAQIGHNRRVINLGGFETIEAAIAARRAAEKQFHGDFECHNN